MESFFRKHLAIVRGKAAWIMPLGCAGCALRAVVFLIIGSVLLLASWQSDPNQAREPGVALLTIRAQPFGRVLFDVVVLGFVAFGAFGFAQAAYRWIDTPGEA